MYRFNLLMIGLTLLSIACQPTPRPDPSPTERTAPPPTAFREYTVPARALQATRWANDGSSTKPPAGPIAAGDYVLMKSTSDTALPAWIEAVYPPMGVVRVQPEHFRTERFTHRVIQETACYPDLLLGTPPSGTIAAGTRLLIIRTVGERHEIFTSTGVRGYVAANDVSTF